MKTLTMKTAAAQMFINDLIVLAGRLDEIEEQEGACATDKIRALMKQHGIPIATKCTGEAHSYAADVDHCGVCLPNWGWCAPVVVLKRNA